MTTVRIIPRPKCQIAGCIQPAVYSARLTGTPNWRYMCPDCFRRYGAGLGPGYGQGIVSDNLPLSM